MTLHTAHSVALLPAQAQGRAAVISALLSPDRVETWEGTLP